MAAKLIKKIKRNSSAINGLKYVKERGMSYENY